MNINTVFIQNVLHTSEKGGIFLENGKKRSIFQAVKDFFNRKRASEAFVPVCQELSKNKEGLKNLTFEQKLSILNRIKTVYGKIQQKDRNQCQTQIQEIEKTIFLETDGASAKKTHSRVSQER